jgi:PKD repeat protein
VSDVRRPALALLLGCLLLVAGVSAIDGYDYYQTIEYAACDQEVYQQDIVIHRTTGTAYNETAGGLEIWHIYVGDHCREDYGDIRFTNSTGELAYYLWPGYDAESARFAVRLEGADAAGTLTVHYGNPTATTTSDGDATYIQLFDPRSYPRLGYSAGFAYVSDSGKNVNAKQGVATDGSYIYTVDGTSLQKYDMSWNLQGTADLTEHMSYDYRTGDLCHYDGDLYIATHCNTASGTGEILVYAASDLSYGSTLALSSPPVGAYNAGAITIHDGYAWILWECLTDASDVYIDQYAISPSWSMNTRHTITNSINGWKLQGIVFVGDYLYAPIHEGSSPAGVEVYLWTGSGFSFVDRLSPPTSRCTQGIDWDGEHFWFAERSHGGTTGNNWVVKAAGVESYHVDTDAWTKVGATLTLSSETVLGRPALKLDRGTTTGRSAFIYQVATLPENYSVRAQVLVTDTSYNPAIGVCVAIDPTEPHGYTSHLEGQSSFTNLIVERAYGATGFGRIASKAAGLPKNVWYTYVVSAAGATYTTGIYDIAGNLLCSQSWEDATYSRQYAGMRIWRTTGYISEYEVRAYSATPPAAITFSGEQETAAPPTAAFTATPTAGLAPLTVQFTDLSGGSPTSWAWTFGDGGTSSEQNPQHTYTAPGLYTVTLNATNEYGSDEEIRTDYITVYAPVTAQFSANITSGIAPLTVQFTDLSTGGPTSWLWTFGDGNTSTAQNPVHTYTTAGTHTVTLTASHPYDSDTETKTAYITIAVLQPFPGLTALPRDLAGTGLYTDINGNNRLDYNDLTVFFQNLAWAKTAQPTSCFDFNGNNRLDYNDVITLFSIIMEEHT